MLDLRSRLDPKPDVSAHFVTKRLRGVAELKRRCARLGARVKSKSGG